MTSGGERAIEFAEVAEVAVTSCANGTYLPQGDTPCSAHPHLLPVLATCSFAVIDGVLVLLLSSCSADAGAPQCGDRHDGQPAR